MKPYQELQLMIIRLEDDMIRTSGDTDYVVNDDVLFEDIY